MKQVKLGSVSDGGVFHFVDDPNSRAYRVQVNRPDDMVWYNAIPGSDDFDFTQCEFDWLTHDVDVFVDEYNSSNFTMP